MQRKACCSAERRTPGCRETAEGSTEESDAYQTERKQTEKASVHLKTITNKNMLLGDISIWVNIYNRFTIIVLESKYQAKP